MSKHILFVWLVCLSVFAAEKSVPEFLQDISVTVKSGTGEGSGVIFTRTDQNSNIVNFVWTAGHVVDDLRTEREIISNDGTKRTIVEFKDAKIIKQILEDGRTIGRLELDAEVIKYSDSNTGHDLALLKIRKRNFVTVSAKFYLDKKIPELGTDLLHVGSLLGQTGANSMTSGIYSQHGRILNKLIFDQSTVVAFPGSSGGGVYLKDGQCVGLVVRGSGETFVLIVPVRRIVEWAKYNNVYWALDKTISLPNDEELRIMPIEDSGKIFENKSKKN